MNKTLHRLTVYLLIGTGLIGCGPSPADIEATSTHVAAVIFDTQTALAPTITPTFTPSPTSTITPTPTATPTATPNHTATAQVLATAARLATLQARQTGTAVVIQQTKEAEDALFGQLVQDGAIEELKKGPLHRINDFDESWAQRGWYQWWSFGYDMADFVFITHIEWQLPTTRALNQTGCGFVFRVDDNNHHLLIFYEVHGNAVLGQMKPSGYQDVETAWTLPDLEQSITLEDSGSADFMVIAEQEMVTAYINGVKTQRWVVAPLESGDIGYTLLSGTNKDFGIACQMTDTRIYELVK